MVYCLSFPGSAWERTTGRLCLPNGRVVGELRARTAEPCDRAFPGGAWERGSRPLRSGGFQPPFVRGASKLNHTFSQPQQQPQYAEAVADSWIRRDELYSLPELGR